MNITQAIIGLACAVLSTSSAFGQAATTQPIAGKQTEHKFTKTVTLSMNYLLYLPDDYGKDKNKRWPLVVFLHGGGERGDDVNKVKGIGLAKMAEEGKKFPFIIVAPQCPGTTWWNREIDMLTSLVDDVQKRYLVDKNRTYLTGLSMGGYGTWAWAPKMANRFAAIAPICGGGDVKSAAALKDIPMWVFHGADDHTVPVKESQTMVDAIKAAGGNPKLTIYPGVDHDSWDPTYANDNFWKWLLEQHRNDLVSYEIPQQVGNEKKENKFEKTLTVSLNHLVYLPEDYGKDKDKRWPLVIFLHGAGERGDDVSKVKTTPLAKMVEEGKKFPFVLVSPQCPADLTWAQETDQLTALLDDIQEKYLVDKNRTYLTGLSMGGGGTWAWVATQATRFAAIAPICGGGDPRESIFLARIPMWIFHGEVDPVIPVSRAQQMADAMKAKGGNPKLTIYPGVGHDSWDPAYADEEFWKWLLEQHK